MPTQQNEGAIMTTFCAHMCVIAAGLALAGPVLYCVGPPDLILGRNWEGLSLLLGPPAVMSGAALLILGHRPAPRVVLSVLGGGAAMACALPLLSTAALGLALLPVGLALAGAAVGCAVGRSVESIISVIRPGSASSAGPYLIWGGAALGVVASFVSAGAGLATALERMTVDYWVGGFMAVSFLGLATALASATIIAILGRQHVRSS